MTFCLSIQVDAIFFQISLKSHMSTRFGRTVKPVERFNIGHNYHGENTKLEGDYSDDEDSNKDVKNESGNGSDSGSESGSESDSGSDSDDEEEVPDADDVVVQDDGDEDYVNESNEDSDDSESSESESSESEDDEPAEISDDSDDESVEVKVEVIPKSKFNFTLLKRL